MYSFVNNLVLAFVLMPVVYVMFPVAAANPQSLAHLFLRSSLASQDPALSLSCFSTYISKSNQVGETYSKDYNGCLFFAKADRQALEKEMIGKRTAIGESSQDICKRLSTCDGLNTTLEVFNCHANIGANNTKAVYSISGNASEYANIMQERYSRIDKQHEKCCKIAERSYIAATADTYRNLQDCLEGRIKPTSSPSTTTTTTTTTAPKPTTTTTTVASISSTTEAEPSSEKPETTSEASEIINGTLVAGTEEFAKLLKLFE